MIPYDEKGFESAVGTVLKPWLNDHVTGGVFSSFDDSRIRYYRADRKDAKAVVVMVHGFCEFFGKFHETAYNFWENGYTVYFMELRGHGGSERLSEDPDVVDVRSFSDYVEDLKWLVDKVILPKERSYLLSSAGADPGRGLPAGNAAAGRDPVPQSAGSGRKLLLYAHSMGGCVGALFLERYVHDFHAAVLTSPMLKMTAGTTPLWQARAIMTMARILGRDEKMIPGMKHFDPDAPDFEGSGSTSLARFLYQFRQRKDPSNGGIYTMNAGSCRWGRAAWAATQKVLKHGDRIRIPLLICQAGHDLYVDNEGQEELARKAKHVKLVRFPDAKHEIYASDPGSLEKYYSEILRFFGKASGR